VTSKTEHPSRKLILIDGNGLAYRSFYAVPPQKTRSGLPTNAALGFTNLLLNVLMDEKPSHVVVAFDQSATSERLQRFQGYNVQREEMPEETGHPDSHDRGPRARVRIGCMQGARSRGG